MSKFTKASELLANIANFVYVRELKSALINKMSSPPDGMLTIANSSTDRNKAHSELGKTVDSILNRRIDRLMTDSTLNVNTPATLAALHALLLHKSQSYLAGYPRLEKLRSCYWCLHHKLRMLPSMSPPYDIQELAAIDTELEYRFKSMQMADIYVCALGRKGPYGDTCARWDGTAPHAARRPSGPRDHARLLLAIESARLFLEQPRPGQRFQKPPAYLATALQMAGMSPRAEFEVLTWLMVIKKEAVAKQVEILSEYEAVKEARKVYLSAMCVQNKQNSTAKSQTPSDVHLACSC